MAVLCEKPYHFDGWEVGCRKCLPCRINHARLWAGRILLESLCYERSSFWTLTYSPEHYPKDGSLVLDHLRMWVRSIRRRDVSLRYFGVGEYGSRTWRAHYHAVLFGVPENHPTPALCWDKGFVSAGVLTPERARYIGDYAVKNLRKKTAPDLQGRAPEFMRCSLKPGIGAINLEDFEKIITSKEGSFSLAASGKAVGAFTYEGRTYTLGRYLRNKLIESVGLDSEKLLDAARKQIHSVTSVSIDELGYKGHFEEQRNRRIRSGRKARGKNLTHGGKKL